MYSLSYHHRQEFLIIPELVRTTMTLCASGLEPTVLIKTLSLSLKFLVRNPELQFVCIRLPGDYLAYGVRTDHDPDYPGVTWSALKTEDERSALRRMAQGSRCVAFLFNELLVNVAWTEFNARPARDEVVHWIDHANLYMEGDDQLRNIVRPRIDAYTAGNERDDICEIESTRMDAWTEIRSTYVTNRMKGSDVSAFEEVEGGQQEEAGLWLIDSLDIDGAWKNPIVHHDKKSRELSDLLLCHSHGSVLIESKTLSVLSRDRLPTRKHMSRALGKHVAKAERQLRGAIRSIKRDYCIRDETGREITVEREAGVHAIVLVPDLALLADTRRFGGKFLRQFSENSDGFLQILDLVELFRMVQAAEILEYRGETGTRMMCFEARLRERFEVALKRETPCFGFLLSDSGSTTVG